MAGNGSAARSTLGTAMYALILACTLAASSAARADDASLAGAADVAAAEGRALLVLFSERDCPYCARLRHDLLVPMQANEGYRRKLDFVEVDIHAQPGLARRHGVKLVPTVVLLGPRGEALTEPLVGYNGSDFYGAYLDERIERALASLR